MNVAAMLLRSADAGPNRAAVRLDGYTLTFRELEEASARVAALLRDRGLLPEDTVGVMIPNVVQFAVLYYGVLRAGCGRPDEPAAQGP